MRRESWILPGLALVLALLGCGSGRGQATARTRDAAPVVLGPGDVAEVARADLAAGVPVSGTLEPSLDVRLIAPTPDVIVSVEVKEGQAVRRGQILGRFRTEALAPAAASAEAEHRMRQSDYQRMQNLAQAGAVSKRDVEDAEAALRAAEANLAQANKRLDDATVRAPFDGVVAERSVQSGDRVSDGDPLFRLVNTASLEFQATVPAEYAALLRVGTPVALTVAGMSQTVSGTIARVNATADAATRQVRVYVTVPNRERALVGDLFASGRVVLHEARGVTAVPLGAVRASGGSSHVWVIARGRLEERAVRVGLSDEAQGLVEVRGAVAPRDTVIVAPIEGLVEGQPVVLAGRKG